MSLPVKLALATSLALSMLGSAAASELTSYNIEGESNEILTFKDGMVLKLTGQSYVGGYVGYIGYIGYSEEAIFLGEKVCFKGKSYFYELYKKPTTHYSQNLYSGAEAYTKVEELCGSLDILK
ncbi:hypothetical protein [Vibrio lentus]|uniref:hypothetical protein n=1 Tax=Vibrio lentus TaxID=136468 RepID=UPI000C861222|nr:hypothetical protein [Vibrio lentus]PMJ83493.1 hypothetical protein BCU14_13590 [Vibrio lentus]PMN35756.1 hypothetical protein BCT33_08950 [Vibrio lentus]PMN58396.1 hypothetical protein BCT29_06360 [Vibrio lentus]